MSPAMTARRSLWQRVARACRIAIARNNLSANEQYLLAVERDGVLDADDLASLRFGVQALRVRLLIAEAE